jgi:hypothetical protein
VETGAPDGSGTAWPSPACGPARTVTTDSSVCSVSSLVAPALGVALPGCSTSLDDSEEASTVGADALSASASDGVRESSETSTTSGIGGGLGGEVGTEATTAGVSVAGIDGASGRSGSALRRVERLGLGRQRRLGIPRVRSSVGEHEGA